MESVSKRKEQEERGGGGKRAQKRIRRRRMLDNVARRYFYGCNGGLFAFHFNSKRLNFFSESRCDLSCERSDRERQYEM